MTVSIVLNFFLEKLFEYWLCLLFIVSIIIIVVFGLEFIEIVYVIF